MGVQENFYIKLMISAIIPSFWPALGEIIILAGAIFLLGLGLLVKKQPVRLCFYGAEIVVFVALIVVFMQSREHTLSFNGFFMTDSFAILSKTIILLSTLACLFLTRFAVTNAEFSRPEYPVLILFSVLGMMTMVSANDLLALFMGAELQALSLYILVAMRRHQANSTESALKYFILGALSTGIFLYGCSLVYGFSGTTNFKILEHLFKAPTEKAHAFQCVVGVFLIIASLGFKLSLAPLHMWVPDVYQGSPTSLVVFLATAPKLAAFSVLTRLLVEPFGGLQSRWQIVLQILASLSMIWGALGVLSQQNIKRFMAYSSIGHMGFVMIGLSTLSEMSVKGSMVYMIFYVLMTLGFFGALLYMARHGKNVQMLSDLNGLGRTYPAIAFLLGFMIFSMAGIPPLPGFLPKLFVFRAAINHNAYFLCCVAVAYSVLAAAYYLVMVKAIFMDAPQPVQSKQVIAGHNRTFASMFVVLLLIVLTLTYFLISPDLLLKQVSHAITEMVY